MFLYYREADCESELIGQYDTIEQVMKNLKRLCDGMHTKFPDCMPSYDEYTRGDFIMYNSSCDFTFYMPSDEEVSTLPQDGFINIIHDYTSDTYAFLVTKYLL
jgi:hypothetical protein